MTWLVALSLHALCDRRVLVARNHMCKAGFLNQLGVARRRFRRTALRGISPFRDGSGMFP